MDVDFSSKLESIQSTKVDFVVKPPTPTATSLAAEQAEQERNARRQRLNEILQRTRQDKESNLTSTRVSPPSSTNGIASGIDATALAQDLLAQRRLQKFQQQQQAQLATKKEPVPLIDELVELGYFQVRNNLIKLTH